MTPNYIRNIFAMSFTLALAATSEAGNWSVTNIAVTESFDGDSGLSKTRVETNATNDARFTIDVPDGGSRNQGTILLISGRWMASRGLTLETGEEIDIMDVATLNSQLAIALLQAAFPEGPPPSGTNRHVSLSEKSNPITVSTTSATGKYEAPWTVDGSVSSAKGVVSYQLTFTFTAEKQKIVAHLTGDVSNPDPPLNIPNSTALDGWVIHRLGPYEERTPTGTKLDYGARRSDESMTVGELRKRK